MADPFTLWTKSAASSALHLFDIVGRAMDGPYTADDVRSDLETCATRAAELGAAVLDAWLDVVLPDHPPVPPDDPRAATLLLPPNTPTAGLSTEGFRIIGAEDQIVVPPTQVVITTRQTAEALAVTLRIVADANLTAEVVYEADVERRTVDDPANPTDVLLGTVRIPWFEQQVASS